jgi:cytoskeletal protein RodZ
MRTLTLGIHESDTESPNKPMSRSLKNDSSVRRIANLLIIVAVATAIFWFAVRKTDRKTLDRDAPEEQPIASAVTSTAPPAAEENPQPTPGKSAATPSAANTPSDESQLMVQLRRVKETNLELAIQLARDGNQRFPKSADAPERASILIHALSGLNRPSEARGEAEDMVNRYPDSAWVHEIEAFTGAHRHRNARVNDAGQLEYY